MNKPKAKIPRGGKKNTVQVYIGPGVGSLGLLRGKVFRGSLPEEVESFVQVNPWMKGLFVPPSEVSRSTIEASRRGTVKYSLVEKLIELRSSKEVR